MSNRIRNPESGRLITVDGPTYKKLIARGVDLSSTSESGKTSSSRYVRMTKKKKKRSKKKEEEIKETEEVEEEGESVMISDDDDSSESDESSDESSEEEEEDIEQRNVEIEEDIQCKNKEELDEPIANDLMINIADAACNVISNNIKKLSSMSINNRRKAIKAMIVKELY